MHTLWRKLCRPVYYERMASLHLADGSSLQLTRRLPALARRRGIAAFHATMMGDNRPALRLLRGLSEGARFRWSTGEIEAEVPLTREPADTSRPRSEAPPAPAPK